ncbi:YceI family protein [Micromonospora sp. NPDC002575]|uniref:YceI family protein n=1 Tax=Micromonospora sp. NPDC002575 TaxID=3364222 RepID=UPI00369194F4
MTHHETPEEIEMSTATGTDLAQLTGTYTIDPSHTRIGFVARHAMVTKVRGAFNEFEGSVAFDAADPARTDVRVVIQATSIDTRNAQRDAHLRSNDFLAMETYPEITFVSTAFRQTGEDTFDLTGDLTVKGVTNSVTIPFTYEGAASDPFGNLRLGFEGAVTINRKDYGVTWNAALETGGVLVSEKITLEFEVSAIKNA